MKYSHFLCVIVLFLSFTLHAQNLEVEGKARITEMELKNDADSVVVVFADGTLARRDVSTLSEIQVLSISNDTIFLTNGGIVKLPVDMDAGWTMNVDTTSTTQYVGIGTINPNRKLHLVGDMELNGSLYSSGNISLANSLSYFGWDIYSDANAYSLSETNVSPRFKIIPGGNIGIGNITPSERLDIDGKVRVRMINNDNALDSVLVSDGNGVMHYRDISTVDDQNLTEVLSQNNDGGALQIKNIADPTNAQDAATKAYVDALEYKLATITNILIDSGIINFVEDIDGNKYNTIKIGDQIWMANNLRVTKYNDGTSIPLVSDLAAWSILSTPAYTWYDTIGTNYGTYTQDTFGALYNYFTVSDTNSLNVCPVGWHVPTNVEWTTLTTTLGGTDVAGGKMKETGLVHWDSPNTGATNESGFTGVPGGQRTDVLSPAYRFIGERGYWWSSTVHGGIFAWFRSLDSSNDDVGVFNTRDKYGMSVRCLRD